MDKPYPDCEGYSKMRLSEAARERLIWNSGYSRLPIYINGEIRIGMDHRLTAQERKSGRITVNGRSEPWKRGISAKMIMDVFEHDLEMCESIADHELTQVEFDETVIYNYINM